MFTGLIEEIGTISEIKKSNSSMVLGITAKKVLENTKLGDSIAVNGVCLTVTRLAKNSFFADVMPQTFELSNLKYLKLNSSVNLERALQLSDRLGGHIVQGHVDATGRVLSKTSVENAQIVEISIEPKNGKYVLEHGSISVDGTSLTVSRKETESFCVSLIPTTRAEATLSDKKIGEYVNLEFDVIGKYVENMLKQKPKESKITEQYLIENGF